MTTMMMTVMTTVMVMMPALTSVMLGIIRLPEVSATETQIPNEFWNDEEKEDPCSHKAGTDWEGRESEMTAETSSAKRVEKRHVAKAQKPEEKAPVCPKSLPVLPHARLICNKTTPHTATMICAPGYTLHDVISATFRRAIASEFAYQNRKWLPVDGVPKKCLPECLPECTEDRRCVAPNVCDCETGECHDTVACPVQVDVQVENALKIVPGSVGGALGICQPGYETKPGLSEFLVPCVDGKWIHPKGEDGSPLKCSPTCFPPCLNGGTCTAPGKCTCVEGTIGCRCQHFQVGDVECGAPEASEGAELIKWSNDMYGLRCTGNQVFPGRSVGATAILVCSNGAWVSPEEGLDSSTLDCGPFCERPCSNGGTCVGTDECQCQPGFGGRFCHIKECPKSYPAVEHAIYTDVGKDPDSEEFMIYIECEENWSLPSGHLGKATLHCSNGQWVVLTETQEDNENLRCIQVPCDLECQNGGRCLGEKCQCPEGVEGESCQIRLCSQPLPNLESAWLDQSRFPQLFYKCLQSHAFPSGLTEVQVRCVLGSWTFDDHGTEVAEKEIESCVPACSKGCLNGGTCWAPDRCKCLRGFTGQQCEIVVDAEHNCYYPLPRVLFAEVVSSDTQPRIQCYEGYKLPSGRTQANFSCNIHQWILEGETEPKDTLTSQSCFPDCKGTCTGKERCVAPMTCGCRFDEEGVGCKQIEGFQCQEETLPVIANAIVWCYDATVHCLKGYKMASGKGTRAKLECHRGKWSHAALGEGCVPHCSAQCQNGGVCKAPEFCECQDGFYGSECQLVNCKGVPPALQNSDVCHEEEGKTLKCASGYALEGGQDRVALVCVERRWSLPEELREVAACSPVCLPPCANGGTCVAPNVCQCQVGLCGTRCEGISCDAIPQDIMKAHLKISERHLTAECPEEMNFPFGETKLHFHCSDHCWQYPHPYQQGDSIECQTMCHPPCLNGGTCTGRNVCSCAKGFYGQQCGQMTCAGPLPYVEGDLEFFDSKVHVTCPSSAANATSFWIECQEGVWVIGDPEKHSLCHPNCPSPCENGGTCTPSGTCLCLLGFGGKSCEEKETFSKCKEPPQPDPFGDIVHTDEEGMLKCHENYTLSNSKSSTRLVCQNDQWLYSDIPNETEVKCQRLCPEECLNGGICVAFRTCQCPKGFSGATCQNYSLCDDSPLPPPNMVVRSRNATSYTAKCSPGFTWSALRVPDLLITCENGVWVKSHRHSCLPYCPDGCLNGGTCVAPNQCQCQKFFEGKKCQELTFGTCSTTVAWENMLVFGSPEGLWLQCEEKHRFSWTAAPMVMLSCFHGNGSWFTPVGWSWALDPCVPECQPECLGGGRCIEPDHCLCPSGVSSSQCMGGQGCHRMPKVVNATAEPEALRLAKVTCRPGHATALGLKTFFMRCHHDLWLVVGLAHNNTEDHVSCQHQCQAPCLNGGSCVAPEECHCPPGFAGERCQYHECGTVPLIIHRASVDVRGKEAAITCLPGHRLPSGRTAIAALCRVGGWRFPAELAGRMSASCLPFCSLPCLNRGRCVAPEECRCAEGFFGVQCEQRYSQTVDGEQCHFPFLHEGHWHYSCTMEGSSLPWCATAVNEQGLVIKWAVCVASVGKKKVVRTECGKTCIFPFQHEGEEHDVCITTEDSCYPTCPTQVDGRGYPTEWHACSPDQGLQDIVLTTNGRSCIFPFLYMKEWLSECVDGLQGPWCPTSVTGQGEPLDKDICWLDKGFQRVEVTEEGRPCVFPFIYEGTRHYTCMGSGDTWCATKVAEDLAPLAWGLCAGQGECTDAVCLEYGHHQASVSKDIIP